MTDSNVVYLDNQYETEANISPDSVLKGALEEDLVGVLVIGVRPDGGTYFTSSVGYKPDIIWHMEVAKEALLREGS